MSNQDNVTARIQAVRSTFEAYAASKAGTMKLDLDVQDVTVESGTAAETIGVRMVIPVEPTIQAVFCPSAEHPDLLGLFVFPGDDSAMTAQHVLEIANAVRSADASITPAVIGVIAPNYSKTGVSFSVDAEEVYAIYENFIRRRCQWLDQRDAAAQSADLKVTLPETSSTPE